MLIYPTVSQKGFVSFSLVAFIILVCMLLVSGYKLLGSKEEYDGMRQQTSETLETET